MTDHDDLIFRAGSSAVDIPTECGRVLSICTYQDLIVLACENGVWTYDPNTDEFVKQCAMRIER